MSQFFGKSAKVTIWLFENPLRNTQIWAKQVCGSLYSPYLAVGRQVSAEANWHAIVTFAVVRFFNCFLPFCYSGKVTETFALHPFDNGTTGLSGKLTPAWFSSNGALIIADSPVGVGINQPPADYPRFKWTFATDGRGAFDERPFLNNGLGDGFFTFKGNALDLKIFFSENAVEAYKKLVEHFGHPAETPPEDLFAKPTWTTWARYKSVINQDVVLQYADDIIKHDYPFNVLEIDDRWQVYYGDLGFDPQRFPNPKQMIDELHVKGFKVTAWVIPFLDRQSQAFADGVKNNWLVRMADGSPYLIEWWQGRGGLLDVTNPSALDWFFGRLTSLQIESGLDGFKFDAGEA
jgi:alpha-glucosidase (family GH31 glycosyl hydrolase)